MRNALSVLCEIAKTTGNGSQTKIIELIKDSWSDDLAYLLNVALNPFITTKINQLELYTAGGTPMDEVYCIKLLKDTLEDLIYKSKAANTNHRETLSSIIPQLGYSIDEEEMLVKIVTKNFNIGLGGKLVNKALGKEFIPVPSLMLAKEEDGIVEKWLEKDERVWAEEKYDGVRIAAIMSTVNNQMDIKFFTRNFNELDGTKLSRIKSALLEAVLKYNLDGNFFFDGELTDINRQKISGNVNKILKGTAPDNIDESFVYNIFDLERVELLDGTNTRPKMDYLVRRTVLTHFFTKIDKYSPITLAERWRIEEFADIDKAYAAIIAKGGEGLILKPESHFYVTKRSDNWIKMKETKECDLYISGFFDGKKGTKRENTIGGFHCKSKCDKLKVDVGSGFSDDLLSEIAKNPNGYIGKVVSVKYNTKISDKDGNNSLFLPRLAEIRFDKTEANELNEIL